MVTSNDIIWDDNNNNNNIITRRRTEFLLWQQQRGEENDGVVIKKKKKKVGKKNTNTNKRKPWKEGVVVTKNKKKSKKNTNNRRKTEPWRASYHISCETQTKLKDASRSFDLRRTTPQQRMERILQLLLEETPPEKCNPANLVCALTISAKIISSSPNNSNNKNRSSNNNNNSKFTESSRSWLYRAMNVLNKLVVENKALNARQLCNAIYAIAKLYNFDSTLLPERMEGSLLEPKQQLGIAEEWLMKDYDNDDTQLSFSSPEQTLLKVTVDMIALQLTDLLLLSSTAKEQVQGKHKNNKPKFDKIGRLILNYYSYRAFHGKFPSNVGQILIARAPAVKEPLSDKNILDRGVIY
eukprot:CAMPEP_0194161626 /NCGR_PEP_ID=MMETSP0152-20130528/79044_1 /TAXON_ID=1049557 /ORGANISM="Thalassiothrix antarctica, Strain L6-D1" /LENGTH=352 /DNA_ID=CAMNT_0038871433 /DNA_START=344 /DNA_END=1403 /DNA_ORIENTATION=-